MLQWLLIVFLGAMASGPFGKMLAGLSGMPPVLTYLTAYLLWKGGLGPIWGSNPGSSGFAVAIDLVIAMPVSWLPVIADYNRFAVTRRQSFTGTFFGYAIGNAWLYALGVLLVLAGHVIDSSPAGIAAGVLGLSSGVVVGVFNAGGGFELEVDFDGPGLGKQPLGDFEDTFAGDVGWSRHFPGPPFQTIV